MPDLVGRKKTKVEVYFVTYFRHGRRAAWPSGRVIRYARRILKDDDLRFIEKKLGELENTTVVVQSITYLHTVAVTKTDLQEEVRENPFLLVL